MLKELKIENLAVIESAKISWDKGFTAITGETGAGKSIFMNALKLLVGAKSKADLIRQGADRLKVEGIFTLAKTKASKEVQNLLQSWEVDSDSDEVIIEREIFATGKSRCRLNGSVVAISQLEELGMHLLDLHGQHQQQSLLEAKTHIDYLDAFARLADKNTSYAQAYQNWRAELAILSQKEAETQRLREQFDFFSFQFKELDKAKLVLGEEEQIDAELKVQNSLGKIRALKDGAASILEGDENNAIALLQRLQRELLNLEKHAGTGRFTALQGKLDGACELLEEVRQGLGDYVLPQNLDAGQLDILNSRLALLQKLKAKYHLDLPGLIALYEQRGKALNDFDNSDSNLLGLRNNLQEGFKNLLKLASELSKSRQKAAQEFSAQVNRRLADLGMPESRFSVHLEAVIPIWENASSLGAKGFDKVEFYFAANPGEAPKPLKNTASGGEVSRIMLALKTGLAESDPRPLLVFDELDTGIGGVTAHQVGQALKELAKHHQLIVITHLHQVAAQAEHQCKVEKGIEAGRTFTRVIRLKGKERVQELARMMGDETSQATLKHARELLAHNE